MKGDRLAPEHHVARHCRKNDMVWTGATPSGLLECALAPDADGVSATWLEFFSGDHRQRVADVRKTVCTFLTPKASNRLAILNVGRIEAAAAPVGVYVVEDPVIVPAPGNPAHALVKEPAHLRDIKLREAIASNVTAADLVPY